MTNPFWTLFGIVALALGAIGVVLPLLPTTPFVLLAAFAFAKGSPRLARMLEDHRIFGPIIEDWRASGAIAPKFKAIAMGMMIATLGLSIFLGLAAHILIIQVICMGAAAAYVLSRPNS